MTFVKQATALLKSEADVWKDASPKTKIDDKSNHSNKKFSHPCVSVAEENSKTSTSTPPRNSNSNQQPQRDFIERSVNTVVRKDTRYICVMTTWRLTFSRERLPLQNDTGAPAQGTRSQSTSTQKHVAHAKGNSWLPLPHQISTG